MKVKQRMTELYVEIWQDGLVGLTIRESGQAVSQFTRNYYLIKISHLTGGWGLVGA